MGISLSSTLRITNTQYEYTISGKMLNLFQADLMLSAAYGSISDASFRVKGSFKNDLYDAIESEIKGTLQKSADKATQEIKKAQDKVNEQQAKFDSAVNRVKSAEKAVENAQSDLNSAEDALNSARDKIDSICHLKDCDPSKLFLMP